LQIHVHNSTVPKSQGNDATQKSVYGRNSKQNVVYDHAAFKKEGNLVFVTAWINPEYAK
jgi:hypothetical protein